MQYFHPDPAKLPPVETVAGFVKNGLDEFEIQAKYPDLSLVDLLPIYKEAKAKLKADKETKKDDAKK